MAHRRHLNLVITTGCLWVSISLSSMAAAPSHIALLRGVRQSRMSLESGHVLIGIRSYKPHSSEGETFRNVLMWFDGDMRRSKEVRPEAVRDPNSSKVTEISSELVSAYDGHDWMLRDGEDIVVDDLDRASRCYLFDPRIIGLWPYTSSSSTSIEDITTPKEPDSGKVVGKVSVKGQECWHVAFTSKSNGKVEFWIGCSGGFRVHKAQVTWPSGTRAVASNEYTDESSPLPSLVSVKKYAADDSAKRGFDMQVSLSEVDKPFEPGFFSMSNLGQEIGSPVVDLRKQQMLGYWNGEGLSPDFAVAKAIGNRKIVDARPLTSIVLLVGTLGLIAVIVFIKATRYGS